MYYSFINRNFNRGIGTFGLAFRALRDVKLQDIRAGNRPTKDKDSTGVQVGKRY